MNNLLLIILISILCGICKLSHSQSINWASMKKEQKHILHLNTGWDYGSVLGGGYSFRLKSKMPILLNASYNFPAGKNRFDDFKTKIGSQFRLYNSGKFHTTISLHGIYRRYGNPLVKLQNFGSELTGTIGYYKPKWFLAGEAGFDKAIVTHFQHSESFKENVYSNITNGWLQPATGGNFNYGIQTGFSMKNCDITLKLGKLLTQDFKTTPLIPFYAQLGYNFKINRRNVSLNH